MGYGFTAREGAAFLQLFTGGADDIVLRTDAAGRIVRASEGLLALGIGVGEMLFPPALADLADPAFAAQVRSYLAGRSVAMAQADAIEFPLRGSDGQRRWYRMRALPVHCREGRLTGFVAILRSIDDLLDLADAAFAAGMTDPLTGLANRQAFQAMLAHLIDSGRGGALALFDLDHFRALNFQHGPRACDELLRSCAALMRQGLAHDHILARIGVDTFAALMPEHDVSRAQAPAQQVRSWFNQLAAHGRKPAVARMNAVVVPFAHDLDSTMHAAEHALIRARAAGDPPPAAIGHAA